MTGEAIRALLVDDEQPARERLARMLSAHADVEIVGEAEDGEDAIDKILRLRPEVVFLDIQMPGCSGMEVVDSLAAPRPRIVFCTAYDEYAVEAFELHAVDYLLKPITRARLDKAIERVRRLSHDDQDVSIREATRAAGSWPERFLGKRGGRFCVVPRRDVLYFESRDGVTRLQTAGQHYWMQPTLNDLEARLDPAAFFRISRSAIVHLEAVREVIPGVGQGQIRLVDDARLEVSRRRFKELMDRLSWRPRSGS